MSCIKAEQSSKSFRKQGILPRRPAASITSITTMTFLDFVYKQWKSLPYPTQSFEGQTIIVTGSNTGLGLEAARHFTRLGAAKVILAVRSIAKGEEAAKSIEASTHRTGVCEVWELVMDDFESVKAFAKRAEKLERLDVMFANAGVARIRFELSKNTDIESTVAINVIGTFLLALDMLPILRKSGKKYGTVPHLCITSSEVHAFPKFNERKESSIFEALKKNDKAYFGERYPVSKLLEVFTVRSLAAQISKGPHASEKVILNTVNPGLCHSSLSRQAKGFQALFFNLFKATFARSTEVGSRTLVACAAAGEESHGKYMSDCVISEPSEFVRSEEGKKTQERVYNELLDILEKIQPGIRGNI